MRIEFIVLACSYKHGGRCLAGIDLTSKRLIRLVSSDASTNYAIPVNECKYNGTALKPLDIIAIEIIAKGETLGAQTENYLVEFPLVKSFIGVAKEKDISPYKFKGTCSPYPFDTKYPFLSYGAYYHRNYSLCLIRAYALSLKSIKNSDGKDKTKISFNVYKFNNEAVRLEDYSVTDPNYCLFDGKNRSGYHDLGKAYLLISLGQDDDTNNYYKFVSGIIDFSKKIDFFTGEEIVNDN